MVHMYQARRTPDACWLAEVLGSREAWTLETGPGAAFEAGQDRQGSAQASQQAGRSPGPRPRKPLQAQGPESPRLRQAGHSSLLQPGSRASPLQRDRQASPRTCRVGAAGSGLKHLQQQLAGLLRKKAGSGLAGSPARSLKKIVIKQRHETSHRSFEEAGPLFPVAVPGSPGWLLRQLLAQSRPGRPCPSSKQLRLQATDRDTRCSTTSHFEARPKPQQPSTQRAAGLEDRPRLDLDPHCLDSHFLAQASRHRRSQRLADSVRRASPAQPRAAEPRASLFERRPARQTDTSQPLPASPRALKSPATSGLFGRPRKPFAAAGPPGQCPGTSPTRQPGCRVWP